MSDIPKVESQSTIKTTASMKKKAKLVINFLEALEDDDDIQHVYSNLEIKNNLNK